MRHPARSRRGSSSGARPSTSGTSRSPTPRGLELHDQAGVQRPWHLGGMGSRGAPSRQQDRHARPLHHYSPIWHRGLRQRRRPLDRRLHGNADLCRRQPQLPERFRGHDPERRASLDAGESRCAADRVQRRVRVGPAGDACRLSLTRRRGSATLNIRSEVFLDHVEDASSVVQSSCVN
jgi:hypothetical protein